MKYVVMRCLKMDINKALSNIDFLRLLKLSLPHLRQNFLKFGCQELMKFLEKKTIFIALNGDYDVDTIDRMNYISLSKNHFCLID